MPSIDTEKNGSDYWNKVGLSINDNNDHYLDDLLATLKLRAYKSILERWGSRKPAGPVLKTDSFEEANTVDALLSEVPESHNIIGMDISTVIVKKARDLNKIPGAEFVAADVRQLPFSSGSIALVFSPSTLDHFVNPKDLGRSLMEIKRVLLPKGVLILTLDNRQNVFDPLLRLMARLDWLPYYVGRSYSLQEMNAELSAAGFEVKETTTLIQHPRLLGVAITYMVNRIGWRWLQNIVRKMFFAAERFEKTRLRNIFGCFVAAYAVPI